LKYDPVGGELRYDENLAWLETVKNLGDTALRPREIMMADTVQINEISAANRFSRDFQICSWALVSFLLNSGTHFRTLTESFMVLSPDASAMANSFAVTDRFSLWTDLYTMDREYLAYLESRRTYNELMIMGRDYYNEGNAFNAEMAFLSALDQRPDSYAPFYYLGLIYYEEGSYDLAEEYYLYSLENGADEALVNYALVINAASGGRIDDARFRLERAGELDPDRYRARTEELIKLITGN